MTATIPARPLPLLDAHSRAWFEAAGEGRLLIQRCGGCGAAQFYPRAHCAGCLSGDVAWVQASGRGRLHSFSVVHRTPAAEFAEDCPYVFALVELEEGVRVTTRVVGVPFEKLRCELPVRVVFPDGSGEEPALPLFTATEGSA